MKTDILERTGNQIAEIAETASEVAVKVKDGWNGARDDVRRAVRKAKAFTEEGVADTRKKIKENPLTSVAAVAGGAFALGVLAGWLISRKRR